MRPTKVRPQSSSANQNLHELVHTQTAVRLGPGFRRFDFTSFRSARFARDVYPGWRIRSRSSQMLTLGFAVKCLRHISLLTNSWTLTCQRERWEKIAHTLPFRIPNSEFRIPH